MILIIIFGSYLFQILLSVMVFKNVITFIHGFYYSQNLSKAHT